MNPPPPLESTGFGGGAAGAELTALGVAEGLGRRAAPTVAGALRVDGAAAWLGGALGDESTGAGCAFVFVAAGVGSTG